jgi:Probable cobalt transporter subunit (CbtA)
MVGSFLLRGMLVGAVAGLLAFGFARAFGEPEIDHAISFEEMTKAAPHAHGEAHTHGDAHTHGEAHAGAEAPEPELVSRTTQSGIGLATGVLVYGAAVGGLFALVFAFAYGRVGRLGPRATAALLALGAYVAVVLVPNIKYPANPPAIGHADTIGSRTALFFLMILISVFALALAVTLARRLSAQFGAWNAAILAGAAFIVVIAIAQYALPTINEIPDQFSAAVLWRFRVASLGIHAVMWTTIGLLFGALTERAMATQFGQPMAARPLAR